MSSPEDPDISSMSALWGKGDKGDKGDPGPKGDKGDKGDRGTKGVEGPIGPESKLAMAAEAEVTRLIKSKSVPKWWGRLLVVICVVLAIVVGYLGYKDVTHPISNQLQSQIAKTNQEQYTSCVSGNVTRANEIKVWDHFVGLLEGTHPTHAVATEATDFESFVASVYAPRDCVKLYPPQG
jgi:hypothetical protein